MNGWHPDLPFCALILFLIFLMYVPDLYRGYRNYKIGREMARQISAEHNARKALEKRAQ
jgi:hypothetical protein